MIFQKNHDKLNTRIIKILSIFVIFTPQLISRVGLKLEQLFTFGLFTVLLYYFLQCRKKFSVKSVFFSMTFLLILTIDALRSIDFFIVRDAFEFIKPFSFLLYFALGYNMAGDEDEFFSFLNFFNILFIIVAILGILEARIPFVNSLFTLLYKENEPVLRNKAILSFINPYCFATILVLPVFYNLTLFFATKKFRYFCFFIICFMCMVFTQSKTILLGFVLSFFIFLLFVVFNNWILGRRLLVILSDIVIVLIIIAIPFIVSFAEKNLKYMYDGFSNFFGSFSSRDFNQIMQSSNSTSLRYGQLMYAIENQDTIPLIGVGIGKKVVLLESFYAMYLYRTGLIGIFLHLYMILTSAKISKLCSKTHALINSEKSIKLSSFYLSFYMFVVSLFFSYFSSAITDQTRIAFFFYVFIGYMFSMKQKIPYKSVVNVIWTRR